MDISLRAATASDIDWLVELRAVVLRDDLERLGVFDEVRVRSRMRDAFRPEWTRVAVADGADVGSVTTRPDGDTRWIEHLYVAPDVQGRGVGSWVLRTVIDEPYAGRTRLNVLQGSPARRLYDRFGFVEDEQDDVDVWMTLQARGGTDRP
ncbi:GNAT family N-acetyltransferase [Curtobacterium luteum]|uniref:GNAT family N-acetyltransferase n=1 Tax=Curtobacterium luteum TaxID=33881 RepID=UPI0037F432F8